MSGKGYQYKIHWKVLGDKKPQTADYLAPSLVELMRIAGRAEDISTKTCEFIYVHQINEKGLPEEVFAYEMDNQLPALVDDMGDDESNVVSIVEAALRRAAGERERAQKPHIKLSHNDKEKARPFVRAAYGRYTAYEAN